MALPSHQQPRDLVGTIKSRETASPQDPLTGRGGSGSPTHRYALRSRRVVLLYWQTILANRPTSPLRRICSRSCAVRASVSFWWLGIHSSSTCLCSVWVHTFWRMSASKHYHVGRLSTHLVVAILSMYYLSPPDATAVPIAIPYVSALYDGGGPATLTRIRGGPFVTASPATWYSTPATSAAWRLPSLGALKVRVAVDTRNGD